MPAPPRFTAADRMLVVAPHPDDETLAAGIAIQSALAAGAAVRVLFATDGDNNPWPQRWLEKRWSIGAAERARWGARRRLEAAQALAALAVDGRVAQALHFGWADQGLTDALMQDDRAVAALAEEIAAFAPTSIFMPALDDRHPDHSALHVMLELAVLRAHTVVQRYCYVVHGGAQAADASADPLRVARKVAAMEAYGSQLALSRRRLGEWLARPERFLALERPRPPELDAVGGLCIPLGLPGRSPWRHEVLLVIAARDMTLRLRGRLPRFAHDGIDVVLTDASAGVAVAARMVDAALRVVPPVAPLGAWAKRHRAGSRIVVFDRTYWHGARDAAPSAAPLVERGVAGPG
ncbi:PIG-L deacetylase family protein [Dokdonella sp.]|uniref:PIG-L deacetylase family protein n=1 Tax=Dokdonella sp. TaxID=2291710 RepID=UPI0037834A59